MSNHFKLWALQVEQTGHFCRPLTVVYTDHLPSKSQTKPLLTKARDHCSLSTIIPQTFLHCYHRKPSTCVWCHMSIKASQKSHKCSSLFKLTIKKTLKLHITVSLCFFLRGRPESTHTHTQTPPPPPPSPTTTKTTNNQPTTPTPTPPPPCRPTERSDNSYHEYYIFEISRCIKIQRLIL